MASDADKKKYRKQREDAEKTFRDTGVKTDIYKSLERKGYSGVASSAVTGTWENSDSPQRNAKPQTIYYNPAQSATAPTSSWRKAVTKSGADGMDRARSGRAVGGD